MSKTMFKTVSKVYFIAMISFSAMAQSKADYAGSESCKKCHITEYKNWKDSYHSKMVRTKEDGLLKDAFEKWATWSEPWAGNRKCQRQNFHAR